MPRYQVLITYRTRPGKDFPIRHSRHVSPSTAATATEAAKWALQLPAVAAMADLFISLTVSAVGLAGTKA